VRSLITESFIFWQRYFDHEDGSRYCRFYPMSQKPHISIIDPRTGELIKSWHGFIEPMDFCQEILSFLEDFGEKNSKKNPIFVEEETKKEKSLLDMSEEEQLAIVLASSKMELSKKNEDNFNEMKKEENFKNGNVSPPMEPLLIDSPQTEGDCSIQIRESNGNILKRMFFSTDKVIDIYHFVSKNRTDGNIPFQLMTPFPKRIFSTEEMMQKTLLEAELFPRAIVIVSLLN